MEATAGDQERGASFFQVDRRHNPHGGKLLEAKGGGPRSVEGIGKGLCPARRLVKVQYKVTGCHLQPVADVPLRDTDVLCDGQTILLYPTDRHN
ncbi:hypothetical protein RR48_14383 [Papilio machaon]|uniref:Uncharacterized protein n=1 Tax=Papilio machaon TaxID=76193 RepID=A0A194QQY3_PAPMA|nr:hypothetical protein RR48_14383 [Papilio machaon]